jgi:hypothetical protein
LTLIQLSGKVASYLDGKSLEQLLQNMKDLSHGCLLSHGNIGPRSIVMTVSGPLLDIFSFKNAAAQAPLQLCRTRAPSVYKGIESFLIEESIRELAASWGMDVFGVALLVLELTTAKSLVDAVKPPDTCKTEEQRNFFSLYALFIAVIDEWKGLSMPEKDMESLLLALLETERHFVPQELRNCLLRKVDQYSENVKVWITEAVNKIKDFRNSPPKDEFIRHVLIGMLSPQPYKRLTFATICELLY